MADTTTQTELTLTSFKKDLRRHLTVANEVAVEHRNARKEASDEEFRLRRRFETEEEDIEDAWEEARHLLDATQRKLERSRLPTRFLKPRRRVRAADDPRESLEEALREARHQATYLDRVIGDPSGFRNAECFKPFLPIILGASILVPLLTTPLLPYALLGALFMPAFVGGLFALVRVAKVAQLPAQIELYIDTVRQVAEHRGYSRIPTRILMWPHAELADNAWISRDRYLKAGTLLAAHLYLIELWTFAFALLIVVLLSVV